MIHSKKLTRNYADIRRQPGSSRRTGHVGTPHGLVLVRAAEGRCELVFVHGGRTHTQVFYRELSDRSLAIQAGRFVRAVVEGRISE